jgi:STE24 endopeptidase
VRRSLKLEALASGLLSAAAAEAGVRLLSPREPIPPPAPVELRDHFSEPEIARGRRYARPQRLIGLAGGVVDAAALAAVVRGAARRTPGAERHPLARAAAGASLMSIGLTLPGLPLRALARQRALKVGLATQTWRGWAEDLVKAGAISGVLAGAAGAAVTGLTRRWPESWWLPAGAGSVVVGAGLATLAPVVLDPIFNDFTPLPAGETRADVLSLAEAARVRVGEVFSVDASRRTTAANAYVTGLGPTKRVVLFDTLLDRYSREEIRVVVAHELAHVRHRDVMRSLAFAALTAPAAALATQRLAWALSPARGTAEALPALALATGLIGAPIGPLAARLSRAVERRADWFSLELSGAPEAFIGFERTIALQNVADLRPPRLVRLLATHPPTDERIGAALAFAAAKNTGGRQPAP